MNKISLVSSRINRAKKSQLFLVSLRQSTQFETNLSKHHHLDRWRIEPMPLAEPYRMWSYSGWGTDQAFPDGREYRKFFGASWFFIFYLYFMGAYWTYMMNEFFKYENLYVWGREEALAQMNNRQMREEELVYLWVQYNRQKEGLPIDKLPMNYDDDDLV